ncbi:MAG TPA: disulfide bond formation protein B [Gimesia maris]|jgi:disulfide bond formation protein DsbB|uniref:Disulfide bond formation protein B n=1 Tax=Gimesia maris TaxID=122 RepID=A0A3D3R7D6_9PLAN|nr:disulfide bond formation protein B [Gimesia maris]|tara:strand:- start:26159 stop:26749 length:591 start_codon:yes stop_codon:yes gene_type:complete
MNKHLGFWIAHFNILAVCMVLLGAFGVQFGEQEVPCPLCMLQRMAMMLCALGSCYIILQARSGSLTRADFAAGYGMSILAAVCGACISTRQILIHIVPPDPGYGDPVLGLHLYTWALVVFLVVLIDSGLNLMFVPELVTDHPIEFNWVSKTVLGVLGAVIIANLLSVFCQEGFHWVLPDDPVRYELFYDLGLFKSP